MKQLFQSMLVGLIALQGLACAGGAGTDAEDTEQGAAEAAEDLELSALDSAPEDVSDEEFDAPERAALLSPSERDEQLNALTGNAVGEPGVLEVEPLENVVRFENVEPLENVVRFEDVARSQLVRSPITSAHLAPLPRE